MYEFRLNCHSKDVTFCFICLTLACNYMPRNRRGLHYMQLHASLAVFSGYVVYGGLILRTVFAVPRKVLASKGGPAALASLTQTSPAVTAYFVARPPAAAASQLACN